MGKIKKAFDKLKPPHSVGAGQPQNRHLNNIGGGNTITINGKEYVKVKLRIVDTLDTNASQYLTNLEVELELLRAEVQKLSAIRDSNAVKIESLEHLNINLYQIVPSEKAKLHTKEEEFLAKEERYKARIAKKDSTILALEQELKQQKALIILQNIEVEKLQKEVSHQNANILELMAQLERVRAASEFTPR